MPGFSAVLSLWRPGEDVTSMLKENQSYQLYNISVAAQRYGELQLNSLKQTRWRLIKDDMGTNVNCALLLIKDGNVHKCDMFHLELF